MAHIEAEALVATCMDLRFQESIDKWIREKDLGGKYDRVAFAGALGNLDMLIGQVQLSIRLHSTHEIHIFNHQNCGFYGDTVVSGSPEEIEKHTEDLQKAKEKINGEFPNVQVFGHFMKLDGEILDINLK